MSWPPHNFNLSATCRSTISLFLPNAVAACKLVTFNSAKMLSIPLSRSYCLYPIQLVVVIILRTAYYPFQQHNHLLLPLRPQLGHYGLLNLLSLNSVMSHKHITVLAYLILSTAALESPPLSIMDFLNTAQRFANPPALSSGRTFQVAIIVYSEPSPSRGLGRRRRCSFRFPNHCFEIRNRKCFTEWGKGVAHPSPT